MTPPDEGGFWGGLRARLASREVPDAATLLELLPDAALVVDASHHIVAANDRCRAVFGKAASELLAQEVGAWVLGADALESHRPVIRRADSGAELGPVWHLHARHADGQTFVVEVSRSPWAGAGEILLVVRDRADDHRVVQRLTRANERLSAARDAAIDQSRAKTVTLARLAQVLRTPLSAMMGYAELLLEEAGDNPELDPAWPEDLGRIVQSGASLGSILKNVVDFAEIEAGRMRVTRRPVPVREAIEGAVALTTPIARLHGVTVSTDIDGAGLAWADPERIDQILRNLLHNACRHASGGTVVVRATRLALSDDEHRLRVTVTDDGDGIDPALLPHLFVAYGMAAADQAGGAGLGLVVSASLARLMDGSLTAHSVVGEGSTFTLELPMVAEERLVMPPMMMPAPVIAPPRPEPALVRVAFGDDAVEDRLTASLKRGDWPVGSAPDPAAVTGEDTILLVVGAMAAGRLDALLDTVRVPVLLVLPHDEPPIPGLGDRISGILSLDIELDGPALDVLLHEAASRAILVGSPLA